MKLKLSAIAVLLIAAAIATDPTAAAAAGSSIAADHFTRNVSNGWGSTDPGGAYSLAGSASDYWVSTESYARGLGYMRVPRPGIARGALLAGAQGGNVEVRLSTYTNAFGSDGPFYVYAVMRSNGANEIRARIVYNRDCSVSTGASVVQAGKERALGAPVTIPGAWWCGSSRTGRTINLRAQVSGTTASGVRVKAWPADGRSEPAAWLWSTNDSAPLPSTSGAVGLWTYVSSTATNGATFMFYNWSARTL